MKKIVLIISVIFSILLMITIFLSVNKKITNNITVYSIPKSYCYKYKENRRMNFEIYINDDDSVITLIKDNTYRLVNGSSYYYLTNINIDVEYNDIYKSEEYHKYTISADILNIGNIYIKDCYLEIINSNFSILIKIGSFKILYDDYEELKYSELYGNFTFINEEEYLIGITITLNGNYYKIYSLSIGEGFGIIDKIEKDIYYDNEIDLYKLNHNILDYKNNYDGYELNSIYDTYFIPISYLDYYLITNSAILLNIDHKMYYIDNFQYLITNNSLSNYEAVLIKGEVKYVKV